MEVCPMILSIYFYNSDPNWIWTRPSVSGVDPQKKSNTRESDASNIYQIYETSSALQWLALGRKSFWMGLGIFIRIFIWSLYWSLVYPCLEFWLSILTQEVQRTLISLGGCWRFPTRVWHGVYLLSNLNKTDLLCLVR